MTKLQDLNDDCLFSIYCYAPQIREVFKSLKIHPDIRDLGYEYGDSQKIKIYDKDVWVGESYSDRYWKLMRSEKVSNLNFSEETNNELRFLLKKILSIKFLFEENLKNDVFKTVYENHMKKQNIFVRMDFLNSFNTSIAFTLYH